MGGKSRKTGGVSKALIDKLTRTGSQVQKERKGKSKQSKSDASDKKAGMGVG